MKKLICCLLSAVILTGSFILPAYASGEEVSAALPTEITEAEEETDEEMKQLLEDLEGLGSWGYDEEEQINPVKEDSSDKKTKHTISNTKWGNDYNSDSESSSHDYGVHGYIIEKANKETSKLYRIPDEYIPVVYDICKMCDTDYGQKSGAKFCLALHGNENYIASITYLWGLAKYIEENGNNVPFINDTNIRTFVYTSGKAALKLLTPTVKNRTNTINVEGKAIKINVYENLNSNAIDIIIKNYKEVSQHEGDWIECCKYITYGMLMHCIGDIYAHKDSFRKATADYILPSASTNYYNNHQGSIFNPVHLSTWFSKEKLVKLKSNIKNGKKYKDSNGILENKNRPVPLFLLKDYVDKGENYKIKSHKKYADNPLFYPSRVTAAKNLCKEFFNSFPSISLNNICDATVRIIDNSTKDSTTLKRKHTLFKFDMYLEELDVKYTYTEEFI